MKSLLLLLLLATLGAAPALAQRPLPPLPDSVYSPQGWVRVVRERPVRCAGDLPVGARFIGCYRPVDRELSIEIGLPLNRAWHTLLHESVHIAARDAHVPYTPIEEDLANAVANRLLAEMLAR